MQTLLVPAPDPHSNAMLAALFPPPPDLPIHQGERVSKKQTTGGTREADAGSAPPQPAAGHQKKAFRVPSGSLQTGHQKTGPKHSRRPGGGGNLQTGARVKARAASASGRCDRYVTHAGACLLLPVSTPLLFSSTSSPAILPRVPCADARGTLDSSKSIRFSTI